MPLLVKILVAPVLIALASWIARRWGPSVGGWFVALPLTSGPTMLLLALERGPAFAKAAALGALLAIASLAAFALAYSASARLLPWTWSSVAGCLGYVVCAWPLVSFSASFGWAFVGVCAALAATLYAMPVGADVAPRRSAPPWDIPVRMVLAAGMVTGVTSMAAAVGPRVAGLMTPFPVATTILAAFTHRLDGSRAAAQLLRGLLVGLFAFAAFLLILAATIERWSVGTAFTAATMATVVVHAGLWYWVRHERA